MDLDLENVMRSWWMFVQAIIAKYTLTRWKSYLIQELFDIIDLFPSLSLYYYPIFHGYQLHILATPIRPIQIFDIVTVDLDRWDFQVILLLALLIESFYFSEDELCCSGQDTTNLINFRVAIGLEGRGIGRALHGVSFTRTSLTVSKDAHIFSIYSWLNEGLYLIKDLALRGEGREYTIKVVKFW